MVDELYPLDLSGASRQTPRRRLAQQESYAFLPASAPGVVVIKLVSVSEAMTWMWT